MLGVISAALHFEPPVALDRLMQFLQNAAAPCALFVLGVTVALRPLPKLAWDVPAIVPVKLVLHPLIVFFMLAWFGPFSASWTYAAVLMAALPPALNVFVLARQYDVWVEEASGSILIGTLVSVFTLTSVMWLVQIGELAGNAVLSFRHASAILTGSRGSKPMPQPLSGIKVIDLTNLLPGPLATLMLAEAGAEIIKIERPGGDDMRGYPPQWQGTGAAFSLLNRGKNTLTLDLKSAAGATELRALLETADILVEQFRPGIMAKLGSLTKPCARSTPS
jgi:hypothetical protein